MALKATTDCMSDLLKLQLPETQRRLIPVSMNDLIRVGRDHDGGYVLPRRLIEAADTVLALGLNDDWSFEQGLLELRPVLRVDGYDPSVSRKQFTSAAVVDLIRLVALRGSFAQLKGRMATVRSYDRLFNGDNRHFEQRITNRPRGDGESDLTGALDRLGGERVLLKMDIEGSEYRVVDQVVDNASRIVGACIEFHDTEPFRAAFDHAIDQLLTRFSIAHVHPNNYGRIATDGLPDVLEITFLNRSVFADSDYRSTIFLPELDQPNNVLYPELVLEACEEPR